MGGSYKGKGGKDDKQWRSSSWRTGNHGTWSGQAWGQSRGQGWWSSQGHGWDTSDGRLPPGQAPTAMAAVSHGLATARKTEAAKGPQTTTRRTPPPAVVSQDDHNLFCTWLGAQYPPPRKALTYADWVSNVGNKASKTTIAAALERLNMEAEGAARVQGLRTLADYFFTEMHA